MKKVLLVLALLLVSTVSSFAVTRDVKDNFEDQTAFGKVVVTGSQATGNPGMIGLLTPNAHGVNFSYYLWIDTTGDVCLSSYPTISAYSSFPNGDWRTGMPCTKVGTQS